VKLPSIHELFYRIVHDIGNKGLVHAVVGVGTGDSLMLPSKNFQFPNIFQSTRKEANTTAETLLASIGFKLINFLHVNFNELIDFNLGESVFRKDG
jgi:hypothetical protein